MSKADKNKDYHVSVVLPTFNESGNIIEMIQRLETLDVDGLEIIVSDGNSTDGTPEEVEGYAKDKDHIRLLRNPEAPELSPSVVNGFDAARGGILCCMDADLQHDEQCLPKVLGEMEKYDMVIGSRHVADGEIETGWSAFRRLASSSASLIANFTLGIDISDPMSGFFAVRRPAFDQIRKKLNPAGFKIMLEIYYLLRVDGGHTVKETGIYFRKRRNGKSKFNLRATVNLLLMLLKLRLRNRKSQ